MRKIIVLILIIIFSLNLNGCTDTDSEDVFNDIDKIEDNDKLNNDKDNEDDKKHLNIVSEIFNSIYLTEDKIKYKYGEEYQEIFNFREGSYYGIYYEDIGITFVFDKFFKDSLPLWVEFDEDIEVFGVNSGMSIVEVQEKLGKTEIETIKMDRQSEPDYNIYKISYIYDDAILYLTSNNEFGKNTKLRLAPLNLLSGKVVRSKNIDSERIFKYLSLSKNEMLDKFGDNYEIIQAEKEDFNIGYFYNNLGITLVFDENDNLQWIECNEFFNIGNIKSGMNYSKIQDDLGHVGLIGYRYNLSSNYDYILKYELSSAHIEFISYYPDGRYANVRVYPLVKEDDNNETISLTDKNICYYLSLNRENIVNELGDNYELIKIGSDEKSEGYRYSELGLTFIFDYFYDEEKYVLTSIICDKKVDYNGTKTGMKFSTIEEILGKGNIISSDQSNKETYSLNYLIDDFTITYMSYNSDGKGSQMIVKPPHLE